MLTELILGAIIGCGILTALGIWYTKNQISNQDIVDEDIEQETIMKTLLLDLPVEKKLRNAVFESERGEAKCIEEINKIIEMQLDLLEGIGKPTFVHLKDKPAFFILHNPISNEKRYYYSRDLNVEIDPAILTDTQRILLLYNEHIDLFMAKVELFRRLQSSHNENLNKINGIHKQNEQLQKIKKHKSKIAELEDRTDIEVNALKNESILEDIERELEYQALCLQQFSQLTEKYDQPLNSHINKDLKNEIKNLIDKIEDEDISKK